MTRIWDGEKWQKIPERFCSECKKFIVSSWSCFCNRCAKRLAKEREKAEKEMSNGKEVGDELEELRREVNASRELVLNILGVAYKDITSYFAAQTKVSSMRSKIVELENEVFDYRSEP